jgi:AcrR family transcriptional regulator
MRDRFRAQVRDEVKQVALRQLAEGGPQALSVNAIAKELGVSGPALYRYFTNRDELLTELIVDAYHDLAAALAEAARRAPRQRAGRQRPSQRLRSIAAGYREWANAQPHRYRLLFTAPFPGYDAQSDRLIAASREAMAILLDVLTGLALPEVTVPRPLRDQLARWADDRQLAGVSPALALLAVAAWSRLHGFVSLEIEGNYAAMGLDPDLLFDAEVAEILAARVGG